MEEKNERKKEQLIVIIILILITIFVIVFLLIKYIGTIEHKPRIPTGNVDIFDIIFTNNQNNCNCNCDCHKNNNTPIYCDKCKNNAANCVTNNNTTNLGIASTNNTNTGNTSTGNITGGDDKDDDYETKEGMFVYDKEKEYSQNTKLNIFKQVSYYVAEDKIAPASENSYQFVVRNNNDFNIIYNLETIENNEYNINMKYRLKLNGKYVLGNDKEYVTASELDQYNLGLASKTYDVYTLDWKWIEDSNDTEIGEEIDAHYKLELKITANQT